MPDVPQDVLDAVAKDGEEILVHVADDVLTCTFKAAVDAGYTILRVVVND